MPKIPVPDPDTEPWEPVLEQPPLLNPFANTTNPDGEPADDDELSDGRPQTPVDPSRPLTKPD